MEQDKKLEEQEKTLANFGDALPSPTFFTKISARLQRILLNKLNEHKKAKESLRLAASVFTHTREGIVVTDPAGNIVDVNAAFTRITQYTREEVIEKNIRFLKSDHHNSAFYQSMWNNLLAKGYWHGEIWNRKKNGEFYVEMKSINAVYDEHNKVINYVSLFKDITEKELHQTHLEHIAHFDALTGLPNRSLFVDRLRQGLTQAQRRGSMLAVVFIDLDEFKPINDKYGHDAGDQVLITTAARMRQALREGDTISRLGGDEFVALLLDLPDKEASFSMLSRLLLAASQPVQFGDHTLAVSASLGVTFYPQSVARDTTQLLRQADQAMYYAKLAGKNNYHIFNEEQDGHTHSQFEYLSRIETALNANEFVLHYQPKVNMRTGEIIGAEASIHWNKSVTDQSDLQENFLSIIKNHPLNITMGEWMLHAILNQMERWQSQGFHMPVSMNIALFNLQQANFLQRLSDILSLHPKVNPADLEFEIVETHAPENMEQVFRIMNDCRELGIQCVLDNFGTGYSSMTYLRRVPVSLLKIDTSFTRHMLENSDALLTVEGAISLANAFYLNVLADGVSSAEHATMLLRLGCDLGQGKWFADPMPAEALPDWAKNWQVEPTWHDVQRLRRNDFPLILASIEINGWCKLIENYLSGMSDTNPILNIKKHQLGIWLTGIGLKQYGTHPAFSGINDLYQLSLNIARNLCADKDNNEHKETQLNMLYKLSAELSKQINLLLLRQ